MEPTAFEQIKKTNEHRQEYWSARDLYRLLGYTEYGKFLPAIERAKKACENSGQDIKEHFAGVREPQKSRNQYGEIEGQMISDFHLSRYACYLIAQNGDPRKEEIALAHHEVGKKIRQTIKELGGTMPEKLPTPEHIKESKKRIKATTKKLISKK